MTETVWLTAARAWSMPVSRISAEAVARLGLTERPNEWCQVRPCNAAGRQEDGFLAKIASTLGIAPPGYPMVRRPCEENFRRPDVVIGTRDWDAVERFLCDMGSEGDRAADRDPQAACSHSSAERRKVVPEPVDEQDRATVQDHFEGGGQVGLREQA
jgi:hypothetical protein